MNHLATTPTHDLPWLIDGHEVERDRSGQGHAWRTLSREDWRSEVEEALAGEDPLTVVWVGGIAYRLSE